MQKENAKRQFFNGLTLLVLILIFQSCKVSKLNTSNDIVNDITSNIVSEEKLPMLAFFTCSLAYDSIQQEYKMSLISKTVVTGKIKESIIDSKENKKRELRYSLLNEDSQVIFQKYMQCPLEKTIEYVDESGRLQKKDIKLDSTEVYLRIYLPLEAHYLSFYMQEKQLLLINLKN